jgi:hypothetical protein
MTVARTEPPKTPIVFNATQSATPGAWLLTTSSTSIGTIPSTPIAQTAVLSTVGNIMKAVPVDPSTLVVVLSPSSNPFWNGELADMPTS